MKIIGSLIIFSLCVNFCFGTGATPVSSNNSDAFSTSVFNSPASAVKILNGSNSSDSANWDSTTSSSSAPVGVYAAYTYFVPATTNSTSYLLGVQTSGISSKGTGTYGAKATSAAQTSISSWRKRTINNTIVATGSNTTKASIISDAGFSTTILGVPSVYAVAPGYLALLTTSVDGTSGTVNNQVYITLVIASTGSATQTKLTSTFDIVGNAASVPGVGASCTITTFTLGNVFYDIGSGAFFFTYAETVVTTNVATSAGTCVTTTLSTANTIYLGGLYLNGTLFWTSPISASTATAANSPSSILGGNDNWLNSSYIYIVYKDLNARTTYYSKTTKSTNTTALGSFSSLIKDSASGMATGTVYLTYTPVSVWASAYTYGITLQLQTETTDSPSPYAYTYTNFLNTSTTGVDSGLSNSAASSWSNSGGYYGYELNTGYSVIAYWQTASSPVKYSYTLATYLANGTVNQTATTIGSLTYGTAQFYEDANGTFWIGWLDVDTANDNLAYNAYLAVFQGQLNTPSGGDIVPQKIYTFILLFVAIFAL